VTVRPAGQVTVTELNSPPVPQTPPPPLPPHTLVVPPPPQVWGAVQLPQVRVLPHPSAIVPQFFPCAAQVVGVQLMPHTLVVPPPPQV
jgi:hypothetical protein